MACMKKKMAKGGMVRRRKAVIPGYAAGGAVAPPMDATDTWNAGVGAPDFDAMQRKAGTSAAIAANQALAANPGAAANIGGSGMNFENLSKKVGVAAATRALRGEPEQQAAPPAPAQPNGGGPGQSWMTVDAYKQLTGSPSSPAAPARPGGGYGMNLNNSLGLTDKTAPTSGISGLSLPSLSSGLGQEPSRPGMFRQGGAIADYRMGGPVSGGPPGVDTVPARLNNGEYVLPVQTTQAFGGKPALDQAVLATTGKPPVGYEQGGMPVRSTYDQLRMRGQDLNAAVDRMTGPPAAPQGFAVPQQSAQARVRPAPRQSEGRLGGGMPGTERQYADGGQPSGWTTDRSAQIENAVNGAMGQPAPVAPPPAAPPAAPEMQLSQGEQYALDSARAAEAAQAPKPSKFETLLRAMTGKPAGYAMGGEVQGYERGGGPPLTDEQKQRLLATPMMASGYGSAPPMPSSPQAGYAPAVEVPARMPPAAPATSWQDSYIGDVARRAGEVGGAIWNAPSVASGIGQVARTVASGYGDIAGAGMDALRGYGANAAQVGKDVAAGFNAPPGTVPAPPVKQGPRGPQRQQGAEQYRAGIRAMDQQPGTQDIPVSIPNEGPGAPVSKTAGPIDMRQANANFRQNVAAIPEGGTMRQYGNTKIYMTRDPKTGQPIFSNISAEAATPAGFETIKAQGKLGGSPFGDPETNRRLAADIQNQTDERRIAEGSPPVGGWKAWQAKQSQGSELNQDLLKETYKTRLGMEAKAFEEQLKQARPQDAENIDALSKFVPAEGMDLALDVVNSAPKLPLAQKAALAGRVLSAYPTRAALREAAIAKLGGTNKWIGTNPTEDEIAIAMTDLLRQSMGVTPPK